jgi:hypothetical protein
MAAAIQQPKKNTLQRSSTAPFWEIYKSLFLFWGLRLSHEEVKKWQKFVPFFISYKYN